MPIIAFVSSKGGVGKTTSAILLSSMLSAVSDVTIIDADPNRPVTSWSKLPGKPDKLRVISDVSEKNIIETIEEYAQKSKFVIVDLEGTASMTVAYAVSRADLVIIPTQGSQLDANEATKAIALVKTQERAFNKQIPYRLLLTRTSAAIFPRSLKSIMEEFNVHNTPVMTVQIHERDAYKAMFSFGGTLTELPKTQVANVEGATKNASAFVHEVILTLKELQENRKVA